MPSNIIRFKRTGDSGYTTIDTGDIPKPRRGSLYIRVRHVGHGAVPWSEVRADLTTDTADPEWWREQVLTPAYVYASTIPYGEPDPDGYDMEDRFELLGVAHPHGVDMVKIVPPEIATFRVLGSEVRATLDADGEYVSDDAMEAQAFVKGVVEGIKRQQRTAPIRARGR